MYTENGHGADDVAARAETLRNTHKACHGKCSVIPFSYSKLVKQNVCDPAVRLKSMTFCCWCYRELAAEFFFYYFFLPLWWWRRKQVTASVSPFVSAWCDNTGIRRCNTFRVHDFSFFTFLLPKVPRPIVLLLVIGRWYKIQFLSQLRKHMSVCFIHKYDWHFK